MSRLTIVRMTVFILALAAAACGERRPDFDIDKAHVEVARAFERQPRQVSVYSDARGAAPDEWIVDFRIDGIQPSLQARFKGLGAAWVLDSVRVSPPAGVDNTPWESIAVLLGRLRGEVHERAEETMARMSQLADLIGGYAVRNGNRFPDVPMEQLKGLLLSDGSISEKDWRHDSDGWGQNVIYHASPDGSAYVLISMGADGALDQDQAEYFRNADEGNEAYAGTSDNPDADIILASGGFVQSYAPR